MGYIDSDKKRRKIIIPRIKGKLIERVDLMSIEEYEKWKFFIHMINEWWWLRSPSDIQHFAADVRLDGSVYELGHYVLLDYGIRPALYLKSNNLIIGNKYYIVVNSEKIECTAVESNIIVANNLIDFHKFDSKSNDYETSEIKQWLNEWKGKIE